MSILYVNISERTFEFDVASDVLETLPNVTWNCTGNQKPNRLIDALSKTVSNLKVFGGEPTANTVSFRVQPHLNQSFAARPWTYVFPLFALAGLFGMKVMNAAGRDMEAFLSGPGFENGIQTSAESLGNVP